MILIFLQARSLHEIKQRQCSGSQLSNYHRRAKNKTEKQHKRVKKPKILHVHKRNSVSRFPWYCLVTLSVEEKSLNIKVFFSCTVWRSCELQEVFNFFKKDHPRIQLTFSTCTIPASRRTHYQQLRRRST